MIDVRQLSKTYEDPDGASVYAVRDASFSCRAGQIYGLLGPNGAGKTTTLRCLATVLTPTSGSAVIAGHDIVQDPQAVRRSIGFLSGTTGLYARLTPRETLTFFARLNGLEGAALRDRVETTLAMFAVTDYADRPNDRLSTGMKQRVGLARAVVHDPPVVIFDEPTSGLDPIASKAVEDAVMALRDAGKCVLLSTHMLYQAEDMCDRLGVIAAGRVVASGTPGDLIEQTGARNLRDAFFKLVERAEQPPGDGDRHEAKGADHA